MRTSTITKIDRVKKIQKLKKKPLDVLRP